MVWMLWISICYFIILISMCVCYNLEDWLLLDSLSVLSGLCDWRKSVIMESTDSGLLRWIWWSPSTSTMVACRGVRKLFLYNAIPDSHFALMFVCMCPHLTFCSVQLFWIISTYPSGRVNVLNRPSFALNKDTSLILKQWGNVCHGL